jgi:adenylylsulfate kinase
LKISKRHLAKSISWRFIGTVDTFVFSWIITGHISDGLYLSGITTITKLIWYYIHERLWFNSSITSSNKRHLIKTFSWRGIGTIDTILFGWLITGNPIAGLKIGVAETVSKMVLYFGHEKLWYKLNYGLDQRRKPKQLLNKEVDHRYMNSNTVHQSYKITKTNREKLHGHKSYLIWFTGLSGSGKSTLANLVEKELYKKGLSTYTLDGDNIRKGINKNLSFTPEDRTENIRRVGEIANLMIDAGVITLAAFISPYTKDRQSVMQIVGLENFIEIYVNTSIEECERRDVKGLYEKARKGEIKDMTGISAPYEAPTNPDLEIVTDDQSIEESVNQLLEFLSQKINLKNG